MPNTLNYVQMDYVTQEIERREREEGVDLREVFAGAEHPDRIRAYWLIRSFLLGHCTAEEMRREGIPRPPLRPIRR